MKILLDGVFNHMGYFSPQWQDVIKNGEKSKFKDWFHINKFPAVDRPLEKLDGRNLNYETFGRTPKMPKLNPSSFKLFSRFSTSLSNCTYPTLFPSPA